jgi:glycerol-3-phosphate dehydrogenase
MKETDVVIIGAGIIGMSLARELTKYQVDVTVIDKEPDVSMGISKTAGSLIYMGLFQALSLVIKDLGRGADLVQETKTERMRMLWGGFSAFDKIAHELDIAHKHVGCLIIARNQEELEKLEYLKFLCDYVPGATLRTVNKQELLEMEPHLTKEVKGGLYDSTGTVSIFGPEYVFALYENALENGANVLLNTACEKITDKNGHQIVETNRGKIKTRFVANCAGKYADTVADMAEARTGWNLVFYRSQALILDKKLDGFIHNIVGVPPSAGKIDFFYPLGEGNIHVYGGQYDQIKDREFTETTEKDYNEAIKRMKLIFPGLSENHVIASYVGVRTFNDKEFDENLIEHSPRNPNFINVLVRMPGFTPAPKIAEKVVGMMVDRGLTIKNKYHFNPLRKAIPRFRFLSDDERNELIATNPRYGRVICRCEHVTEGEIAEAVKRGARTVQGVMFRTRAGMGRCQRNWCGPKVIRIMAKELHMLEKDVTFKGAGFSIVK